VFRASAVPGSRDCRAEWKCGCVGVGVGKWNVAEPVGKVRVMEGMDVVSVRLEGDMFLLWDWMVPD
jgi:hypothetical protein